jgi:hypothetical protein
VLVFARREVFQQKRRASIDPPVCEHPRCTLIGSAGVLYRLRRTNGNAYRMGPCRQR